VVVEWKHHSPKDYRIDSIEGYQNLKNPEKKGKLNAHRRVDRPAGLVPSRRMRLIVARCEVRYSGRLDALLPEALRLIMVKSDGSVLVHADHGSYKPSNCRFTMIRPGMVVEMSLPYDRYGRVSRVGERAERLRSRDWQEKDTRLGGLRDVPTGAAHLASIFRAP
jgi:hypothetical protein